MLCVAGSQNSVDGIAPRLHVGRQTNRLSNYGRIKTLFCSRKHPDLTDTHQASFLRATGVILRCIIPVVCVTNVREESVVNQHN